MTRASAALKQARKAIGEVSGRLLNPTPETVAACLEPLSAAIACMTEVQSRLDAEAKHHEIPNYPESPSLRRDLAALRAEVHRAGALLGAAGAFYEGYGRLIGCESGVPGSSGQEYGQEYKDGYRGARSIVGPTYSSRFDIHG